MIDGLKVPFTGDELRQLLDQRVARYRASAAHWNRESERTSDDATEDEPLLPEHMCKNEAALNEWRASVFTFVRERVDASELYWLGVPDLKYFKLLPAKPELVGPYDADDSTDDTSELGPYATRICNSPEVILITNPDASP